jgi:hypothetical protein
LVDENLVMFTMVGTYSKHTNTRHMQCTIEHSVHQATIIRRNRTNRMNQQQQQTTSKAAG